MIKVLVTSTPGAAFILHLPSMLSNTPDKYYAGPRQLTEGRVYPDPMSTCPPLATAAVLKYAAKVHAPHLQTTHSRMPQQIVYCNNELYRFTNHTGTYSLNVSS